MDKKLFWNLSELQIDKTYSTLFYRCLAIGLAFFIAVDATKAVSLFEFFLRFNLTNLQPAYRYYANGNSNAQVNPHRGVLSQLFDQYRGMLNVQ